ncbi:MAG: hypothetical protein ABF335_07370 [Alphaproteobacteria bacterium]
MKHHIMLAVGILIAAIFSYQGAIALMAPGIGLWEAYILGGLVLAGLILRKGLILRREHLDTQD